ncbi:MAG: hypothetical protein ACYDAY_11460 [Candidatus Dormibacteria bacterium]
MGYSGASCVMHDGTPGVHLITDTCPTGCYIRAASNWTGDTTDKLTSSASADLAANPPPDGSTLSVVVTQVSPIMFDLTVG